MEGMVEVGMDGIVYCKSRERREEERREKRAQGKRKKGEGGYFVSLLPSFNQLLHVTYSLGGYSLPLPSLSLACCYFPPHSLCFCLCSLCFVTFRTYSFQLDLDSTHCQFTLNSLKTSSLLLSLFRQRTRNLVVSFSIVSIFLSTSTDLQEF